MSEVVPERELADFSPGSSHLHGCPADLDSENACTMGCIHYLYAIAQDAERQLAGPLHVEDADPFLAVHDALASSPEPFDAGAVAAKALEHGEDPLPSVVGQLAGFASACWAGGTGDAVFQSELAAAVVSTLSWLTDEDGLGPIADLRLVREGQLLVITTPEDMPMELAQQITQHLTKVINDPSQGFLIFNGAKLAVVPRDQVVLEHQHADGPAYQRQAVSFGPPGPGTVEGVAVVDGPAEVELQLDARIDRLHGPGAAAALAAAYADGSIFGEDGE